MGNNKKNADWVVYLAIGIFGLVGIYSTFFASDIKKFDGKTTSYEVNLRESSNSDGETVYYADYLFKVENKEYICKSNSSSNAIIYDSEETIYYDTKNPNNCLSEKERSSNKIVGIIMLLIAGGLFYFFRKQKDKENLIGYDGNSNINVNNNINVSNNINNNVEQIDPVKIEKINNKVLKFKKISNIISIIFFIIILGITISAFISNDDEQNIDFEDEEIQELSNLEICGNSYTRTTDVDSETIRFGCDNSFSYFYSVGDPVDDSDLCETYTYIEGEFVTLNCEDGNKELKIIKGDELNLEIEVSGETRKFQREVND